MEGKTKKALIRYVICVVLAGMITFLVVMLRGDTDTLQDFYKKYCDAFTISGGLFLALSLLLRIGEEGIFDTVGYLGRKIFGAFIPMFRLQDQSYSDYKAEKKEKRAGGVGDYFCFLFTGLLFFLVGIVFLILYYNA